ncbi:MAG: TfoX/Sxy family protein [Gaiellaceae bacterium]
MTELETLPNVGSVLAGCLRGAGIESPEELRALGAERAFERLRAVLPDDACLSKLYALAGAIEGVRWHDLPPARKTQLKTFARQG